LETVGLTTPGGIGPQDQLTVVKNSKLDGETMINETDWINLPVGENLMDHPNVRLPLDVTEQS
jgi:cellobiose dehydrogenase (acceptor)